MSRPVCLLLSLLGIAGIAVWSATASLRPKADFSFCSAGDVESLDPAQASDSAAERVVSNIFEGLCVLDPETLEPRPGVARNVVRVGQLLSNSAEKPRNFADSTDPAAWACISPDGETLTFDLRTDARWSDGTPVTATDFVYSFRRVLDPLTAAPSPHLLADYLINAEKYHDPNLIQPGDPVEVELPLEESIPSDANVRGVLITGTFVEKNSSGFFSVRVGDQVRVFHIRTPDDPIANEDAAAVGDVSEPFEPCRQVLFDFREVGIRALDEHTLELKLIRPNPSYLQILAHMTLCPVNQRCLEAHSGAAWTQPDKLVCNGPYVVQERRLRDRIRLVKNAEYWDAEHVSCEIIDDLTIESPITMLNLFESGEVDWIPSVPTSLVDELANVRAGELKLAPVFSTYFYVFNCSQPPFDDPRVRRAFCEAVNRDVIISTALRGGQLPATSFVPGGIAGYAYPHAPPEDRQDAAALLAAYQAEHPGGLDPNGRKLSILYNTGETHRSIAELLQTQWRSALGLNLDLENREFGAYRGAIVAGEFDLARSGWTGDVSDPVAFLHMFVSDSEFNDARWSNAEYDSRLTAAATERDPQRRLQLLAKAEAILLHECPIIPLYHRMSTHLVRPEVSGFFTNPADVHPLKGIAVRR